MASELEVTKSGFYSDYKTLMELQHLAIEDARFLTFVGFLNDMDIYSAPFSSRYNGTYKNGNWSILGYCYDPEEKIINEEQNDLNDEGFGINNENIQPEYDWNYTIFNGFFSNPLEVNRALKSDITKCVNEAFRFIEMSLDEMLINDICEARELQDHVVRQKRNNSINRIDICIVTDSVIDQDNLENKITSKKHDLDIRIYYWDIKKYNDLKRSKQKRLPINIDFTKDDFVLYEIEYISKTINEKLSYFLTIFPAKLIADLYSIHRTQLLENNVRVFLQKKTANIDMRKTISDEPIKFFSYNNGISATAESVETLNGKIVKVNDFQIVNGGQTTATLDLCNKSSSLENVFVAVKITSLFKDKDYSDIVGKISSAANTQTAVKKSDFDSGKPILLDIERISRRNMVLDENRRSIYYFFERMAGQYNVTKSIQGTDKKIQIWERSNPKSLAFDKIDIARWFNAMSLKPYLAAEGAEKQFKEFINADHSDFGINQYKSLLGFGLLFNRIKKLCGTSNGKVYPSLTIDNNGNHAPVAMSTALYTISYLHYISKGCFDYWGVYEYKFGVVNSLINSNNRIESKLDDILVQLIKLSWGQILHFGGAAAQEKTKGLKMWEDVKNSIILPEEITTNLKPYLVSNSISEKRNSKVATNEYEVYFEQLNDLLVDNGRRLFILQSATSNSSVYKSVNTDLTNFINKLLNASHNLPKNKTNTIFQCFEKFQTSNYDFNIELDSTVLDVKIDFINLYKEIFVNADSFIETLIATKVDDKIIKKVKDIVEKLYREYGLSLSDLKYLNDLRKK